MKMNIIVNVPEFLKPLGKRFFITEGAWDEMNFNYSLISSLLSASWSFSCFCFLDGVMRGTHL